MLKANILEQINQQLSQAFSNTPLTDIEKNVKTIIIAILNKLDIVTREEFDIQQKVLLDTRNKLEKLEQQIKEIKAQK
jgi:BMFP domain-containing protein YqiC